MPNIIVLISSVLIENWKTSIDATLPPLIHKISGTYTSLKLHHGDFSWIQSNFNLSKIQTITQLRNPIDRALSMFHDFKNLPLKKFPMITKIANLTFDEYLESPELMHSDVTTGHNSISKILKNGYFEVFLANFSMF